MYQVSKLQELIEQEIRNYCSVWEKSFPTNLYQPVAYAMNVGGKRIRPLLVLLAYQLFRDTPEKIMNAAVAIELFHNFTLLHDDIMDKAELRRNQPSVHIRYSSPAYIFIYRCFSYFYLGRIKKRVHFIQIKNIPRCSEFFPSFCQIAPEF